MTLINVYKEYPEKKKSDQLLYIFCEALKEWTV